ncbi:hypothetical protein BRX37_19285 [Sphingomonas sp. S-NIH.Pt3_0716]|nr:hypothetical protein BRX37_19285 [Sphingomonas sp. S-NIH.Pt3_0716]
MRPGTTPEITAALAEAGITTALLARLDFKSGTVGAWTGGHSIKVTGWADSLLNDQTFHPLENGVIVDIGDNSFSYSGSEALEIALGLPSSVPLALEAAAVEPTEYQGRTATIWRALLIQPGLIAEPHWVFRRIRSGTMDTVEVSGDGLSRTFKLSIEGHAGMISNATQGTYLDQPKFDPNDRSQDYVAAIANGDDLMKLAPTGWAAVQSTINNWQQR